MLHHNEGWRLGWKYSSEEWQNTVTAFERKKKLGRIITTKKPKYLKKKHKLLCNAVRWQRNSTFETNWTEQFWMYQPCKTFTGIWLRWVYRESMHKMAWGEDLGKIKLQGENGLGLLQIKIPDSRVSNMRSVMGWWKYDLSPCVIKG